MDEQAIKAVAGETTTPDVVAPTEVQTEPVVTEETITENVVTEETQENVSEPEVVTPTEAVEETIEEVVETKEVQKEDVVEDVKENLTTESKDTVDEVIEKEANGEELNKHEQLVSDLLDEIQSVKTNSRWFELENEVLKKTVEKLQEQVVNQKSNPNIVEVPDDLLPLVKQYAEYSKDRSKDDLLMKVVNATYWVVDMLGWPSLWDSVDSFVSYKQKTNNQWSGNRSESTAPIVKTVASTWKGWISLGVTWGKYSFTNRTS